MVMTLDLSDNLPDIIIVQGTGYELINELLEGVKLCLMKMFVKLPIIENFFYSRVAVFKSF